MARRAGHAAVEGMVVNGPYRLGLLEVRASALADKDFDIVRPLPAPPGESGSSSGVLFNAEPTVNLDHKSRENLFYDALKLRNKLLTNMNRYKLLKPQSVFDQRIMTAVSVDGSCVDVENDLEDPSLTLTLFPALARQAAKSEGVIPNVSELFVPARNFVLDAEDDGMTDWQLLTKAVVVVDDGTSA